MYQSMYQSMDCGPSSAVLTRLELVAAVGPGLVVQPDVSVASQPGERGVERGPLFLQSRRPAPVGRLHPVAEGVEDALPLARDLPPDRRGRGVEVRDVLVAGGGAHVPDHLRR